MSRQAYDASVLVLAGGLSSRMGTDKGRVELAGKPLIEHVLDIVKPMFTQTLIITNEPEKYNYQGTRCVKDRQPGLGPMMGLYTGLCASNTDINMLISCDMPFISSGAISLIMSKIEGYDAAIPQLGGRLQPLLAVYHQNCREHAWRLIESQHLAMHDLMGEINVQVIYEEEFRSFADEPELMAFSVNSPEDLEYARQLLEKETDD